MYEVTVNVDSLPKGADVDIDGLGRFKNGSTTKVSKEDAHAFQVKHSTQSFSHTEEGVLEVETELGPTVYEAFKSTDGIDVAVVKEEKKGNDNA